MNVPNPQAEYLAALSKTEWTLAAYDSFSAEYAVISRHQTEAEADAAKATQARRNPKDELVVLAPG